MSSSGCGERNVPDDCCFNGLLLLLVALLIGSPCLEPVESLSATCDQPSAREQLKESGEGSGEYEVDVAWQPDLAEGTYDFDASLKSVVAENTLVLVVPPWRLHAPARVYHNGQALPPSLMTGTAKLDEVVEGTVALSSRTGRSLSVLQVRLDPPDSMELARWDELRGDAKVFGVLQRVAKVGLNRGEVAFSLKGKDGSPYELVAPFYSHGMPK